jgi:hypothetical protein
VLTTTLHTAQGWLHYIKYRANNYAKYNTGLIITLYIKQGWQHTIYNTGLTTTLYTAQGWQLHYIQHRADNYTIKTQGWQLHYIQHRAENYTIYNTGLTTTLYTTQGWQLHYIQHRADNYTIYNTGLTTTLNTTHNSISMFNKGTLNHHIYFKPHILAVLVNINAYLIQSAQHTTYTLVYTCVCIRQEQGYMFRLKLLGLDDG